MMSKFEIAKLPHLLLLEQAVLLSGVSKLKDAVAGEQPKPDEPNLANSIQRAIGEEHVWSMHRRLQHAAEKRERRKEEKKKREGQRHLELHTRVMM